MRRWDERTEGLVDVPSQEGVDIRRGVKFYNLDSHISASAIETYKSLNVSCLVNAGTPRKITDSVFSTVPNGVLNVHPGILPYYRGCSCVEWAIFNDDRIGNTIHFMDSGYDTGPIIEIEPYTFPRSYRYAEIRSSVYIRGCVLAAKYIRLLQEGSDLSQLAKPQDINSGKFWKPMDFDTQAYVIDKVNSGRYNLCGITESHNR